MPKTMGDFLAVRGARLSELLRVARSPSPTWPQVRTWVAPIEERWRMACAGGDGRLFAQRLAWEGLREEELSRRLAQQAQTLLGEEPSWLCCLRQAVPPAAPLAAVPSLLAQWARARWSALLSQPPFAAGLAASFQAQLRQHLQDLLAVAGGAGLAPLAWDLFEQRPVLARLVADRTRQWTWGVHRLCLRFRRDRQELSRRWGEGEPLLLQEATLGLSDRHGGEAVARLVTSSGKALYYKPRSLEPERVLQQFFDRLRGVGLQLVALPPMLARRDYGWQEEVCRAHLGSKEELEQWFFAAGHLAVAAWLLGLRDLHWENVVAAEAGPVVVDGENWCQPQTLFDPGEGDTLLTSGLVTFLADGPQGLREDGALLGGSHPRAASLPLYRGGVAEPSSFSEALRRGVEDGLDKVLRAYRTGALPLPWEALRHLQVRWIPRSSEVYASFLTQLLRNPTVREGWHVSVMVEALKRPLLAAGPAPAPLWVLAQKEAKALEGFAIPRLTLPAARRGGMVRRSGKDLILRRLHCLGEGWIAAQLRILDGVLDGNGKHWPRTDLLGQVATILREREARLAPRVGPYLRRGWAGRALAWAAWGRAAGDPEALRLASWCLRRLDGHMEGTDLRSWPLGFGTGLGGVVYALASCGQLLEKGELVQRAEELALWVLDHWQPKGEVDVEGGVAGLLLGCAAVARLAPRVAPALAPWGRWLAQRVGAVSARPLAAQTPGFAHGCSGVAAALTQVAKLTGELPLLAAAVALLEQEPAAGHWTATAEGSQGLRFAVKVNGWCHGPAGALLARELLPERARTPVLEEQRRQARARVFPLRWGGVPSLCCGTIGRSEISLLIGELTGDEQPMREARHIAAALFRTGRWQQELDPAGGLFDGLSGFLYLGARLLAPGQVGSVLAGCTALGER
ncbi:MAG: DUF4135 domain-containing protein [Thermoanaerobaculum sp.]|nr:DUF4135 domain-containing protein [Thermoanaerobaculum sp.]MDW7968274.1 DUF4135 domain-containing protein [Thermoanaerobaculum sp.]